MGRGQEEGDQTVLMETCDFSLWQTNGAHPTVPADHGVVFALSWGMLKTRGYTNALPVRAGPILSPTTAHSSCSSSKDLMVEPLNERTLSPSRSHGVSSNFSASLFQTLRQAIGGQGLIGEIAGYLQWGDFCLILTEEHAEIPSGC